jgi:hypothetical protein
LSKQVVLTRTSLAFLDWINERFPWKNAILFFILYLAAAVLARATLTDVPTSLTTFDVLSCALSWSFFLLIRIFDEHKDYEKDLHNHPQRVLQSGRLTLNRLKLAGGIAVIAQLGVSLTLDGGFGAVTTAWLGLIIWLCLMGKEFFCGEWLERKLLLYAVSHMVIMPFIVFWFAQLAAPGIQWNGPLIGLSALALLSGFAFEITRKTWGPEEERDTIDSYARILGLKRSVTFISLMVVTMTLLQAYLIWELVTAPLIFGVSAAVLGLSLIMALKTLFAFRQKPSSKGREKNEAAVGIATLIGYLVLIVAVLVS